MLDSHSKFNLASTPGRQVHSSFQRSFSIRMSLFMDRLVCFRKRRKSTSKDTEDRSRNFQQWAGSSSFNSEERRNSAACRTWKASDTRHQGRLCYLTWSIAIRWPAGQCATMSTHTLSARITENWRCRTLIFVPFSRILEIIEQVVSTLQSTPKYPVPLWLASTLT